MYCTMCGNKLKDDAKFCAYCGAKIKRRTAAPPESQPDHSTEPALLTAVEQLKNGDEQGFESLYSHTYQYVYSRAKYLLHGDQEAFDLVQEVYLAAYRSIGSLNVNESIYAWLGAITFRQGMKIINKKRTDVLVTEENEEMFEALPDQNMELEEDYTRREDAEAIRGCIDRLSEEQKAVILAYYFDNMKVEEIAEATDTSPGTIKSRLFLARKYLREYITEQEKKQGYAFRSSGMATLVLAIRIMLEEDFLLSPTAAQHIFDGICGKLGISAGKLISPKDPAEAGKAAASNSSVVRTAGKIGARKIVLYTVGILTAAAVTAGIVFGVLKSRGPSPEEPSNIETKTDPEESDASEAISPDSDAETPTDTDDALQDPLAEKYYAAILSEYQQAAQNDFSGDSSNYPHVNRNLFNAGSKTLYYTTVDLCGDGEPELFISYKMEENSSNYEIIDIYGYTHWSPQRLEISMGLGTLPLGENETMGTSSHYTICDNNWIKEVVNSGTDQNSIAYYSLEEYSASLFTEAKVVQDGTAYSEISGGGLSADYTTEAEYHQIAEQYAQKEDIVWYPLSEFKENPHKMQDPETVHAMAQEYYGDFLQYYKEQEAAGFTQKDLEFINPMFSDSSCFPEGFSSSGISLYYTLADLADDGIPELLISDGQTLYGAFAILEGEGQLMPLIETEMGRTSNYYLCENNFIKCESASGSGSNLIAYYQVDPHASHAACSEAIKQENGAYSFGTMNYGEFSFTGSATAADYEELSSKYPLKENITWLKLSDF